MTNDPAAEALLALLDYSLAHPHQQQLGGPGGHPVLRLLLSRLQDGSAPGARGDGFKLGLVVEGGGMRGIVTGAMLMGLQDMGLVNVFDAVYGEGSRVACAWQPQQEARNSTHNCTHTTHAAGAWQPSFWP